jgi:hypothetical protein
MIDPFRTQPWRLQDYPGSAVDFRRPGSARFLAVAGTLASRHNFAEQKAHPRSTMDMAHYEHAALAEPRSSVRYLHHAPLHGRHRD